MRKIGIWFYFVAPIRNVKKVSEFYEGAFKTPADIMKRCKSMGIPYSVRDEKEVNGKVVQLTFIDLKAPEFSIIFYYGLGRCKASFDAAEKQREREQREIEKRYGK